jgi:SAM-dependent methyltransferase
MKREINKLLRRRKPSANSTREAVTHDGFVLPPSALRFCGEEFKDDAYYLKSARLEAKRLALHCGLNAASRVLDVGCGTGRLAIGILAEAGDIAAYHGLDVHLPSIEWCTRHIHGAHPSFRFTHLDLANARYNPGGRRAEAPRLPLPDASVDIIDLYSVFSHLTYGDVVSYLAELRRVVSASGRVFLTGFIEDGVPNFQINPPGYREPWSGPLHCVRFERSFFDEMLAEQGFRVDRFDHGREANGQSAYYLSPVA